MQCYDIALCFFPPLTGLSVSPTAPVVELRSLSVSFANKRVLDGLDLTVEAGCIYALLGGNGAGKSTTLSVLLGFVEPTAGEVSVAGMTPWTEPERTRAQLAYLPENVALYGHLTATENVDYLLSLSGRRQTPTAIANALRAAGLQQAAWNQRLAAYSKGMRQKVAIAIALMREVPLLLLDEPTSGLDPGASAEFHALLEPVRARGTAVLMVTHDLLGAIEIADRIGLLDHGRIVHEAGRADFDLQALHGHFSGRVRTP